jgi:hypothetical protein
MLASRRSPWRWALAKARGARPNSQQDQAAHPRATVCNLAAAFELGLDSPRLLARQPRETHGTGTGEPVVISLIVLDKPVAPAFPPCAPSTNTCLDPPRVERSDHRAECWTR